MVDVPTEVRAPVVAATLEAPLERRLAHVADLDLIVDEGVVPEDVALAAQGDADADVAFGDPVAGHTALAGTVDEDALPFIVEHRASLGIVHALDGVLLDEAAVGHVEEDAELDVARAVALRERHAVAAHEGVAASHAHGAVARGGAVARVHVVDAVLGAGEVVEVGLRSVDVLKIVAVADVAKRIVIEARVLHVGEEDAVAAIEHVAGGVAFDRAALDYEGVHAVGPDAEARALKREVDEFGAVSAVAHHHARVARIEVAPVVAHGEVLDPDLRDADDEARAPTARVDDGALLAPHGDAREDFERSLEFVDALLDHDLVAVLGLDDGVVKLGEVGDLEGARLRPEGEAREGRAEEKPRECVHAGLPQSRRLRVISSYL